MSLSSYRNRLRLRVNGLLVQDEALLMVKMRSPVTNEYIWIPPGGGVEVGESMEECLIREFREETGLKITVGSLRHINELVSPPFHAVEFYFDVLAKDGQLSLGSDPEQPSDRQILEDLQFINFEDFHHFTVVPEYLEKQFIEDYCRGKNEISFART